MKPAATEDKHIVDTLIEERAPRLSKSILWPLLAPALRVLLNYKDARHMADAIAPLSGRAALDYVSRLLRLNVNEVGLENVPRQGRSILVVNHPTGIADGIAVYDALNPYRPDLCFFANADAHRVCSGFDDVLIPVVLPAEKRTMKSVKTTMRLSQRALEEERPVVIFPSGAVARHIDGKVQDPEWEHSPVALARKYDASLIAVHVEGPPSRLHRLFDYISDELRDMTLFHELLNKASAHYRLTFSAPIEVKEIEGSNEELSARLKEYVEHSLSAYPDARFS